MLTLKALSLLKVVVTGVEKLVTGLCERWTYVVVLA
jgi:hypothetical protein